MDRDKSLLQRLHDLEMSVQDFKSPQPVGTDSVRTYTNLTNNQWDVTWSAVNQGPFTGQILQSRVRFVADHQDAPFGRIRCIAEFDGVKYDIKTPANAYGSSTQNYMSCGDELLGNGFNLDNPMLLEFENPQMLRFEVRVSAKEVGVIVKLKFIVDATDTGKVTWL
jgi:hypothetical protein